MTERRSPTTLAIDYSDGGAAALAVNGALVAAARETCAIRCGERQSQQQRSRETDTGSLTTWLAGASLPQANRLPERAIAACLERGRLAHGDVERIVIVNAAVGFEDSIRGSASHRPDCPDIALIDPFCAGAWQLAAVSDGDTPMLIVRNIGGQSALFRWCHGKMTPLDGPGIGEITTAISTVSRGLGGDGSFDALERFSGRRDASVEPIFDAALTVDASGAIAVNGDRLSAILAGVALNPRGPYGIRPEHQPIAAAFCHRAAIVLCTYVRCLLEQFEVGRIGFVGDAFSIEGIRAILADQLGESVTFAPFSERLGRAAGAALVDAHGPLTPLRTLALGPVVTETDVKATLDNCRLDYVYEPDWGRLLLRTSRMLSRGNVVAWFNGSAPFGGGPDASRATLCDPSKPFARENVNRFLRLGDVNDPLTVFLPSDDVHDVVTAPVLSSLISHRATPRDGFRDRLRAALDPRGQVSVQVVTSDSSALYKLLQLHRQETGVPGLIASTLGADENVSCSPRDAVRATFSSAVDALVIERFLVMKDWWLLRSR